MNGRLDLRIITQPHSEVHCGYFRRLVFGNSLTKHNKLSSFSYSVVILFLPLSHIPPYYHTTPPNFPHGTGPNKCKDNEMNVMIKHDRSGFEPATQWSEVQHATSGLPRPPVSMSMSSCDVWNIDNLYHILPWTRDRPRSIQVMASRGILDDIPPPIYHP